jgi:spermidine/putrescine transport system permease protein
VISARRSIAATGFLAPPSLWLAAFFLLPMVTVVLYSFWRIADYNLVADFTFSNYEKLARPLYVTVFWRTLKISIYVTVLSLLIGYPVAYYLARKVRRFRLTLLMLVILPLWTSYLVRTYAWMLLLGTNGVVNHALQGLGLTDAPVTWLLYSDFAVTIALVHIYMPYLILPLALVHIYMPYLILPLYAVLEKLDPNLLEASRDLDGGRLRTFLHVTLPLSLPGVATGCLFVFIPSMGSFVTPELLGGTRSILIGSIIAQQFGVAFEYPFGSAMSLVVMAMILVVSVVVLRTARPAGVG